MFVRWTNNYGIRARVAEGTSELLCRIGEASGPLGILRNGIFSTPQRIFWYLFRFDSLHILSGREWYIFDGIETNRALCVVVSKRQN